MVTSNHGLGRNPFLSNASCCEAVDFRHQNQLIRSAKMSNEISLDMDPRSPTVPTCCFCFSNRKKGKGSGISGLDIKGTSDWGKNDEMLSDMSTFSVKEQQRRLKKAMEEEEKVVKEAERVVKWVKQESSRMDVSAINRILKEEDEQPIK